VGGLRKRRPRACNRKTSPGKRGVQSLIKKKIKVSTSPLGRDAFGEYGSAGRLAVKLGEINSKSEEINTSPQIPTERAKERMIASGQIVQDFK